MRSASTGLSKKNDTIITLFRDCKRKGNYEFDNDLVKEVSIPIGFRNHNDATKLDQSRLLPDEVKNAGYCVAHLGNGRHRFIKKLDSWYHRFEEMSESDKQDWNYTPSLLNHTDTSESNIISMVYNQRVIHNFLYEDITADPKIYLSRRTKITTSYRVGSEHISAKNLQMEMDATLERNGVVTILEGKNNFPADFSVYQLFHPFLYYRQNVPTATKIQCCYLLQKELPNRLTGGKIRVVRLYLYSFSDIGNMSSIELVRKAQYTFNPNTGEQR